MDWFYIALFSVIALAFVVWQFLIPAVKRHTSKINVDLLAIKQRIKVSHDKLIEVEKKNHQRLKDLEHQMKTFDIRQYRQLEALVELNRLLGFNITGMRGWALSPDAGLLLYRSIIEAKPELVLELGGGVSSLIIAAALKQNGRGKLVSIDHDQKYADITKSLIADKGFDSLAEVRIAPLKQYKVSNKKYRWYDTAVVTKNLGDIDYLVVDGPPGDTNKDARLPAVSLLLKKLSKKVTIFIDDYGRADEIKAAEAWLKLLPGHKLADYDTEKGAATLTRR